MLHMLPVRLTLFVLCPIIVSKHFVSSGSSFKQESNKYLRDLTNDRFQSSWRLSSLFSHWRCVIQSNTLLQTQTLTAVPKRKIWKPEVRRELYLCCVYSLKSQKLDFVFWALFYSASKRHQFKQPFTLDPIHKSVGLFHTINSVLISALLPRSP